MPLDRLRRFGQNRPGRLGPVHECDADLVAKGARTREEQQELGLPIW